MKLHFESSIVLFGMPMGLLGLALSVQSFEFMMDWPAILSWFFFMLGGLAFVWMTLQALTHIFIHKQTQLHQEWRDPLQISLFGIYTLTLLLSINSLYSLQLGQTWLFFAYFLVVVLHTLFSLILISRWLFDERIDILHLKPAWFIVLSGNFYVVIVGEHFMQQPWQQEFLWFYFAYSLLMWLVVATWMLYRLIFVQPIRLDNRPSLFIFIAPPSLASVAALTLMPNQISMGIWFFWSFATIMILLWLMALPHFFQARFSMLGWAYVYPLAAYAYASQSLAEINTHLMFFVSGVVVLLLTIMVVLGLLGWMLKQLFTQTEL